MSKFVIVYLGGEHPSTPQEGQKHMAKYMQWLASLGEHAVSPANPLKNTHVINAKGEVQEGSNIAMSGYTVIEAETLEEALKLAKGCPFLEIGGTLEVSELIHMPAMG